MAIRVAMLMLLALMVTACTSTAHKDSRWKPGLTKDALDRDDEHCRQMTTVQSPGSMVAGVRVRPSAEVDENAYAICMEAEGYEKIPKDFVPPK